MACTTFPTNNCVAKMLLALETLLQVSRGMLITQTDRLA